MTIPLAQLPPEARRLHDRFEFLAELGRGGMAVVYLARVRASGQPVAVKLVSARYADDPEAAMRFEREARTVGGLRHPNLVRTLGVEALDGQAIAIVNAYVDGRTLRTVLREVGAFRFEAAARVLCDLAAGLAHAHAARIVHRDVKPENVFLENGTGRALLGDFGIARPLDTETQLTQVGSSLGTPTYMAPEQVDGRPVDPRADVYALGLVGWEMLSGRRPWQGETLYAVLHKQKHERLPDLAAIRPDIPAYLLLALEGALEKEPARRWRDAGEFLERLTPRPLVLQPAPHNPVSDAATLRRVVPGMSGAEGAVPGPVATPLAAPLAAAVAAPVAAPVTVPAGDEPPVHPRTGPADVMVDSVPEVATPVLTGAAGRSAPPPSAPPGAPPGAPPAAAEPWRAAPARRRTGRRLAVLAGALAVLVVAVFFALANRGDDIPSLEPVPLPSTAAGDVRLDPPAAAPAPRAPASDPAPEESPARRRAPVAAASGSAPAPVASVPRPPATPATPASTPATTSAATPAATPAASPVAGGTLAERCRSADNADQRACLLGSLGDVDARLTSTYQALIADYRRAAGGEREPLSVRSLRSEQRLWLVERDRVCRLRTRERAGERWGAARLPCFQELADRRAAELATRRQAVGTTPRRRVGTGEDG